MIVVPHGPLVYAGILTAAMIEGEITYVAASALVAQGTLNPLGVIIAGAIGAGLGDQFYFYLLRRRLTRWMTRFPSIVHRAVPLVARVRRHQAAMVFLIRFAPGLRIALAAACAYAEVDALLFSTLNFVAAFIWATALLFLMTWVGPTYLSALGVSGWKAALVTGAIILLVCWIVGLIERRTLNGVRPR